MTAIAQIELGRQCGNSINPFSSGVEAIENGRLRHARPLRPSNTDQRGMTPRPALNEPDIRYR